MRVCLLALRLLLQAYGMASDALRALPAVAQIADDARQLFDQVCPSAKDTCDMIEHFAEYGLGTGNRQPGGKLPRAKWPIDGLQRPRTGRSTTTGPPAASCLGRLR